MARTLHRSVLGKFILYKEDSVKGLLKGGTYLEQT
jgi:hypothetical protein